MIASLTGKIKLKKDKFIVLEAGNVGYKIFISPDTFVRLSELEKSTEQISLWTYDHIREDARDLFGFSNYDELEFFELLLSVSGIGPRSALGILGIASIETLKRAVSTGDTTYLTKISGIGKKTAEKIILELRDKVGKEIEGSMQPEIDALEALKALGYSQNEAREALKKVSNIPDTNKKVKEALKVLGR